MKNEQKEIRKTISNNMTFWVKNIHANTTILMLHGISSSSAFLGNIGKYQTNFNIVVPDLPGSKNGPRVEGVSIQMIAETVVEFIKSNISTKKLIVLGHSLGGAVTAHVANSCHKVKEVIFLSPLTPKLADSGAHGLIEGFVQGASSAIGGLKNSLIGNSMKLLGKTLGFKNLDAFTDPNTNEYSLLKNNVYNSEYMKETLPNEYAKIKQNKCFIISEKDIVVNHKGVREFAEELNSELLIIPGTDHNPFNSQPQKVIEILNEKYPFKKRWFFKKLISYN